jgi:hypothetical protein
VYEARTKESETVVDAVYFRNDVELASEISTVPAAEKIGDQSPCGDQQRYGRQGGQCGWQSLIKLS